MKASRALPWAIIAGFVLVLVVGVLIPLRPTKVSLPVLSEYKTLPALFNETLQATYRRIEGGKRDPEAVRTLAHLYQANGLYSEALVSYRWLATSAHLSARDHYYLADLAQNRGDLPEAEKEFQQVLTLDPTYLPARLTLAEILFKTGQEDAAARLYAIILEGVPDHLQASVGLARIELQRGNDAGAVSRLEKLMAAHPEATSGAALLAQIFTRRGEIERAAAMAQWSQQRHEPVAPDPWLNALLFDSYDPQRLTLKFEEYFSSGQLEEALPLMERIEALEPRSWIPRLLKGWREAKSLHHAQAVAEYQRALEKGGDPEKIGPLIVVSLLALGNATEAEKFIRGYYEKNPDSAALTTSYADLALRKGDEKIARQLYSRLLEKQPYLYTPNRELARIAWAAGEREEAVPCLQRIAKAFPSDLASRGLLGEYYSDKGNWLSALPPLEEALALRPPSLVAERLAAMLRTAYLHTAGLELEKGQFSEAAFHFDKAVQISPNDLEALAGKANCYVQLKQFSRAAEALETLRGLQPGNPTIELSLGDVLYQAGDKTAAPEHWEKALQLVAAGDEDLRKALHLRLSGQISAETFK